MISLKINILLTFFLIICAFSFAQEGTRTPNAVTTVPGEKILLIPFEPKLYMSEMDMKINQQTKWNFDQIRENFRHQLDAQLKLKLQSTLPVVSFYSDSVKMSKDLLYVYKSTNVSYDLVDKPTSATVASQKQTGIKNGQIEVEMNTYKKFMNIKITDLEMLPYLTKKYKTDYFVFVNELDIEKDENSYDIATDTYQRQVMVHYSILDKTGKIISAGISTSHFSSKVNEPKKIVALSFSPIATYIATKFSALVNPSPLPAPKKK